MPQREDEAETEPSLRVGDLADEAKLADLTPEELEAVLDPLRLLPPGYTCAPPDPNLEQTVTSWIAAAEQGQSFDQQLLANPQFHNPAILPRIAKE